MKYSSLPLLAISIFLASCATNTPSMMNGGTRHGNGMMQGGGMMGGNQTQTAGFLPGQSEDVSSLPEVQPSSVLDVQDGQTISLNPTLVRKNIGGKWLAMYGYNGQIPGPLIKAKQGTTITVDVKNNIDLPTTIHWHGIRLENSNDGVPDITQKAIEPDGTFRYTVTFPDEGIYWYHPHVREDIEQDLGLYGNLLVSPLDESAYAPVNSTDVLALDDILLDNDGLPVPYGQANANFALMGRFGNMLLVNGEPSYDLSVARGTVERFIFTNVASTRTFRVTIPGAKMKLVGADVGRYEREQFVESVTLGPAERAIVDVLFDKSGTFTITHQTPQNSYALGTVTVSQNIVTSSYAKVFSSLATHEDVVKDIDAFRPFFDKSPDHTLILDMTMMNNRMMGGGMMGEIPKDGIEWEDAMGMMNTNMMGNMMQWKMIDQETGAANKDLVYTAKVGDKLKIRIINKKDSAHPMQHPIHFHGQRFLVLSDNGVKNTDFVWKDTTLVPAGHTVDILLDITNPGDWMFHCHIAEHLSNGMMGLLKVQ